MPQSFSIYLAPSGGLNTAVGFSADGAYAVFDKEVSLLDAIDRAGSREVHLPPGPHGDGSEVIEVKADTSLKIRSDRRATLKLKTIVIRSGAEVILENVVVDVTGENLFYVEGELDGFDDADAELRKDASDTVNITLNDVEVRGSLKIIDRMVVDALNLTVTDKLEMSAGGEFDYGDGNDTPEKATLNTAGTTTIGRAGTPSATPVVVLRHGLGEIRGQKSNWVVYGRLRITGDHVPAAGNIGPLLFGPTEFYLEADGAESLIEVVDEPNADGNNTIVKPANFMLAFESVGVIYRNDTDYSTKTIFDLTGLTGLDDTKIADAYGANIRIGHWFSVEQGDAVKHDSANDKKYGIYNNNATTNDDDGKDAVLLGALSAGRN